MNKQITGDYPDLEYASLHLAFALCETFNRNKISVAAINQNVSHIELKKKKAPEWMPFSPMK